jgi:hypothetical protein
VRSIFLERVGGPGGRSFPERLFLFDLWPGIIEDVRPWLRLCLILLIGYAVML